MNSHAGYANLNTVHGYTASKCGYCQKQKTHWTCGFACSLITTQDYQAMMDRGWRRCGDYWYRPENEKNCCKMFTIRLNVENYQMRKSHKKVMKRWNRYLEGEDLKPEGIEEEKTNKTENENKIKPESSKKEIVKTDHHKLLEDCIQTLIKKISENTDKMNEILGLNNEAPFTVGEKVYKDCKVLKPNSNKFGDYSNNLIMLLFAENKNKLANKNMQEFIEKVKGYIIENLEPLVQPIKVSVQPSGHIMFTLPKEENPANGETQKKTESTNGIDEEKPKKEKKEKKKNTENGQKIQIEENKGDDNKPKKTPRKFEIKLEKAKFDQESFEMYRRYCASIHEKQKEDPASYESFLCMQTLVYDTQESNGKTLELGCYHMKYYVDGKFIAVGVVDITPVCLSSVYFFYDPDYKDLSMGVVGAIKEIEYVQEMHKYFPDFKYYYLGYYIQDCQKMVYKGDYEPAELLCPITMNWVPLTDQLRAEINKVPKITRLSPKHAKLPEDMDFSNTNLEKYVKDKAKIYAHGAFLKIIQLNKRFQEYFINAFKDIAQALGKKLFTSFVFAISE